MGWFRRASNRLQYRGRLSRKPYSDWVSTNEGVATVDSRMRQDRLRLFARTRARRRIWRELDQAARTEPLRAALQAEADRFSSILVQLSHAPGLPRRSFLLHRLVIVPRALLAGRIRTMLRQRLHAALPGAFDARVCDFFSEQLIVELERAMAECRPSVSRPFLAGEQWACLARDTEYQWVDPIFAGQGWGGYLVMFEFPRQGLSRKTRRDLERAVADLQDSLALISTLQRHDIMRLAVDGLATATA